MKFAQHIRALNRSERFCYALIALAALWSVFRIGRSFQILFAVSDDLYTYFAIWSLMQYRDMADIAVRQSLYLPHTWFYVTPLFLFGFPAARILALTMNICAVLFIWWRLSELTQLRGPRRALLLVLFTSWLSTGLVLGLGNLALVCVALTVAAYPFKSPGNAVALAFSAMKQSIAFPVYLQLLLKKPKALIIPACIFLACGLAVMWWAKLGVLDVVKMAQRASDSVSSWTQYDHTCVRRLFALFLDHGKLISLLSWGTWLALFVIAYRCFKDPLVNLAGMLLICLLPMYHNIYDMVVAAPVLAVLLQRTGLLLPAAMSLTLAANLGSVLVRIAPTEQLRHLAERVEYAYYPIVILSSFSVLWWLSKREQAQLVASQVANADKSHIGPSSASRQVPQ